MNNFTIVIIDGQAIVNTTPHSIRFQAADGSLIEVENCGALVNARAVEEPVGRNLVTTKFVGTDDGETLIREIKAQHAASPDAHMPLRIVGSIIAAQAYPGEVVGMTPMPGFERVAPSEKRMNPQKFTVYLK